MLGFVVAPYMISVFMLGERAAPAERVGAAMTLLAGATGIGYAVGSAGAGRLADATGTKVPFRPAVKAAGLPPTLRFHDLRHAHAALLIADGWHPLAISRRLGDSTITVTMDRYGHLLPSLEAELLARSAETFTRSLTPTGTDGQVTVLR